MKMKDNLMYLLELEESYIIFLLQMKNIQKDQQEKCLFMLKLKMKFYIIMVKNVKMGIILYNIISYNNGKLKLSFAKGAADLPKVDGIVIVKGHDAGE